MNYSDSITMPASLSIAGWSGDETEVDVCYHVDDSGSVSVEAVVLYGEDITYAVSSTGLLFAITEEIQELVNTREEL